MYTGHFAAALIGAERARRLPLSWLIVAAFCGDITEGFVAWYRVRDPYRVWSHSVPATAAAGFALGLAWFVWRRSWRESAVLFAVALTHSAFDYVTAIKIFWPGAAPMGLNLYTRPLADGAIEIALCVLAWFIWRRSLPTERRNALPARLMLPMLLGAQATLAIIYLKFGSLVDARGLSKFVR